MPRGNSLAREASLYQELEIRGSEQLLQPLGQCSLKDALRFQRLTKMRHIEMAGNKERKQKMLASAYQSIRAILTNNMLNGQNTKEHRQRPPPQGLQIEN